MSPSLEEAAGAYLTGIEPRLRAAGYDLAGSVRFEAATFWGVARREKLSAAKAGMSRNLFVFQAFSTLDEPVFRAFAASCFQFATKSDSGTMPRGFGGSVWVFSVAMVPTVDQATSEAIRTAAPPKHVSAAEVPVIVELDAQRLHYFEKTPLWGAAYHRGSRKTIKELLTP